MRLNITTSGYFRVLRPDGTQLSQHSQIKEAYEAATNEASKNVNALGDSGVYTITSPNQTVRITDLVTAVCPPPVECPPCAECPDCPPPVECPECPACPECPDCPPVDPEDPTDPEEPTDPEPEVPVPPNGQLRHDLSYVNKASTEYAQLISLVNSQLSGTNNYGFEAKDAVWAYRLTGDDRYRALAVQIVDRHVADAEARIAAGQTPVIMGDSALEAGPYISDLAHTYQFCNPTNAQKARWKAYADQVMHNIWSTGSDAWGGSDTGWGMNDPGNNYFYSFCHATVTWALASNNQTLINYLINDRFVLLNNYFGQLTGGGSREGTGYGLSAKGVFEFMQIWKDSGYTVPANVLNHARDSVKFWTHALLPARNRYQPIGDLAREATPYLMEYHLELVMRAGYLIGGETLRLASDFYRKAIRTPNYNRTWARRNALFGPVAESAAVQPLNYYGAGTGNVFGRTSWDDDARYAHFIAGPYDQSHAAQEQGGFTYAAGSFLAVNSNIYTASGIEQGVDYYNVVKFSRNGTAIRQRNAVVTPVVDLKADGGFDVSANLKPVYNDNGILAYSRRAVFADGGLTITDTFNKTADVNAQFLLHTPVAPTISGNVITAGRLRAVVDTPGVTITQSRLGAGYRIEISGGTTGYTVRLQTV